MQLGHVPPPLQPCLHPLSVWDLASVCRDQGRNISWAESSPRAACFFVNLILEAANTTVMLECQGFQRSF